MSSSVGIETARPTPAHTHIVTHVPGIGRVTWSKAELDAHAGLLHRTHRPDQPTARTHLRWLPRSLFSRAPQTPSCCASCALDWPCPEVRWAGSWLSAKQRFLRAFALQSIR